MGINITPLYDRIIIEPVAAVEKESTIIVVELESAKRFTGRVVEVGQGYLANGILTPLIVRKKDLVLYPGYAAGLEYFYEGKKYIILKESDIIGVIKE